MVRSISFKGRDSDHPILRSLGSGRMEVERNFSLDTAQPETTTVSISAPILPISSESVEMEAQLPQSPKQDAALKLQKVYKSFRTRRKLADCAVLGQLELEQSWWSLLDSAELKRSSVSFFNVEKQETAVSRWSRAKTRAAKVGKGLSKNHKARKLTLQHWLEAIDPRHRYGHNLHFYYQKWLHCQSREPFFYWLDVGEGKDVNVGDKCPRSKLQQQCIKYLGPMERKAYEVVAVDGRLMYMQTGEFLDTVNDSKDAKWIFVLSTAKILYVGKKKKGTFQHSSFLAGGAASAAGRLVVQNGILKAIWPHSGHYTPTKENFDDFIIFLEENNVDLTDVQKCPMDEEDASICKRKPSFSYRESSSEGAHNGEWIASDVATEGSSCCIAKMADVATAESESTDQSEAAATTESSDDDCHEGEKETTFEVEPVSTEETKVCPLGKRLSRTWTSGAGPRISCVRDYPWELQLCALEQVNLSPRSGGGLPMEPWTPAGLSAGKDKVSSPGGMMGGGGDKVLSPRSPNSVMCGFTRAQQLFSPLGRGTSVGPNFSQA